MAGATARPDDVVTDATVAPCHFMNTARFVLGAAVVAWPIHLYRCRAVTPATVALAVLTTVAAIHATRPRTTVDPATITAAERVLDRLSSV